MENMLLVKAVLLSVFFGGGIFMLILGFLIWRKLWDGGSIEVEAECIDLGVHTQVLGSSPDCTYYSNSKRPVYRYSYQGTTYVSSPLLSSNRPGYKPQPGPCTIRIDPKHPEKVYSSERKFAALICIIIGAMWVTLAVAAAVLADKLMASLPI